LGEQLALQLLLELTDGRCGVLDLLRHSLTGGLVLVVLALEGRALFLELVEELLLLIQIVTQLGSELRDLLALDTEAVRDVRVGRAQDVEKADPIS
jgi:hypothetical protein